MKSVILGMFLLLSLTSQAAIKVALVFDKGGKDDKSFNASAYQGALEAQRKLGAEIKFASAVDINAFETLLKGFAKKDFDLIIGIGVSQLDAMKKVAPLFPAKKFLIVDAEVNAPNVVSALFQEHEGSYLAGAMAAMASKKGIVGFIGGMDIPLIRRFEMGFDAGIKKINPKAKLISNYVGVTGEAWNNPPKAKELALAQISAGADVLYHAAGASGAGVFDAAEEKKVYVIGVDSNQNYVKPGRVLTSMLKRVDQAVYSVIESIQKNTYKAGVERFGLKNQGIDLAFDSYNKSLITPQMKTQYETLKKEILADKIIVPDYYKK